MYRELPAHFTTEQVYSQEHPTKIPNFDPNLKTFSKNKFFITFNFAKIAPSFVGNNYSSITFDVRFKEATLEPLAFCAFTQERSAITITPKLTIVPLIIK